MKRYIQPETTTTILLTKQPLLTGSAITPGSIPTEDYSPGVIID